MKSTVRSSNFISFESRFTVCITVHFSKKLAHSISLFDLYKPTMAQIQTNLPKLKIKTKINREFLIRDSQNRITRVIIWKAHRATLARSVNSEDFQNCMLPVLPQK